MGHGVGRDGLDEAGEAGAEVVGAEGDPAAAAVDRGGGDAGLGSALGGVALAAAGPFWLAPIGAVIAALVLLVALERTRTPVMITS